MRKRIVLIVVVLAMAMSLAGVSADVGSVLIDTLGTAFLSGDNSYLPLKNVASFLGASVGWDVANGQAVINYNGQDLALTPNSTDAIFKGNPVVLSAPTVVVDGVTYIPAKALNTYYNVPIAWDRDKSEVKVKGPKGWGTVKANSRPPWHGGPPPWAPAWGERRKAGAQHHLAPGKRGQHNGEVKQKDNANANMNHAIEHKNNGKPHGKGKIAGRHAELRHQSPSITARLRWRSFVVLRVSRRSVGRRLMR